MKDSDPAVWRKGEVSTGLAFVAVLLILTVPVKILCMSAG